MKKKMKGLASKELQVEVDYHLDGLMEAGANIRQHIESLRSLPRKELEETANILTELDTEIFFHLKYHLKNLRRPFKKLHDKAYERLESVDAKKHGKEK